ncbi:MAG: hypothetical protein KDJ14_06680 [Xanthomonadales bacterium]|nr:hypothetical protein [Xanthomonadales bacterium]
MSTLIAATVIAATAVGGYLLRHRPAEQRRGRRSRASRPLRITDPQTQNPGGHRLWQLQTNGCQCVSARRLGGRRLDVEDTEPVGRPGSASMTCRCYYRPLAEMRHEPRRFQDDRRAHLRFDLTRGDRRMEGERRRFREAWGVGLAR